MSESVRTAQSIAARVLPHRRNHPPYQQLDDGWYSALVVNGMLAIHLGRSGSIVGQIEDFEIRNVGKRPRRPEADGPETMVQTPEQLSAERASRLQASRWLEAHTVHLMLRLMSGGGGRLCTDRLDEIPLKYRSGETPWEDDAMAIRRSSDATSPILVGCPTAREAEVLADLLNRIEMEKAQELTAHFRHLAHPERYS